MSVRSVVAASILALSSSAAAQPDAAAADSAPAKNDAAVIPPGREAMLLEMLGGGAADLPEGCRFERAGVERVFVRALYQCAGRDVTLELRHPDSAAAALGRSKKFAITGDNTVPAPLVAWLAQRLQARDDAWNWTSGTAAVREIPTVLPVLPSSVRSSREVPVALAPADRELVAKALHQYEQGLAPAPEPLVAVVRRHPRDGMAAVLQVLIAAAQPDAARLARWRAAAAAPDADGIAHFVAGTALHYAALAATGVQQRTDLSLAALEHLRRAAETLVGEPRILTMQAVALQRIGSRQEALAAAEKAAALAADDPEVAYARAFARLEPGLLPMDDLKAYGQALLGRGDEKLPVPAGSMEALGRLDPEIIARPPVSESSGPGRFLGLGLLVAAAALAAVVVARRRRAPGATAPAAQDASSHEAAPAAQDGSSSEAAKEEAVERKQD